MKKRIFLLSFFLLLIFLYFALQPLIPTPFSWNDLPEVSSQKPTISNKDSIWIAPISDAQSSLLDWQKKLNAPSLSVAVGHKNQILWAAAVGYSDIDAKELASKNTVYRIGSISKSVTSVALATLLEKKSLTTADQLSKLLPNYKLVNPTISVKQLGAHTAGIRHYGFCWCIPIHEGFSNEPYTDVKDAVSVFGPDALKFEPGDDFNYSTYGYTMLSAVIQEVSQQPFLDYLQTAVLNPLNMTNTYAGGLHTSIDNKVHFYEVKENQYKDAFALDISNKWAGGGLLSTPSDLVKMGNALQDSSFLSLETKAHLFTPVALNNGTINPQNYGLGWRIDTSERILTGQKVKIIHHGGTIGGGIALLILLPKYNLTVALMTNRSGSSRELFDPIYEIVKPFMQRVE